MAGQAENLCPTCGGELKAVQNLDSKDSSSEDFFYDCLICGYRYSYVLEQVLVDIKGNDPKPLFCPVCDKHFSQSVTLRRHMLAHSGDRPFSCKECDKTFKTKAALKRHLIIHTGECPFECSTCKRKFNQISNLRKHLVIHNNNCPFYCTVCGKGFNQLSNLKKHSVVHRDFNSDFDSVVKTENITASILAPKSTGRPVLTFIKPAKL